MKSRTNEEERIITTNHNINNPNSFLSISILNNDLITPFDFEDFEMRIKMSSKKNSRSS